MRWSLLLLLSALSFVSYVLRTNISIAAKLMMPELGIDEVQMGRVFSAFLVGYALLQMPAGALGDRFGPRSVFMGAALIWGVATLLTGLVPGGAAALAALLVLRFVLGGAQATTYPVGARAVGSWFPEANRAFANSFVIAGLPLGSAITPPIVSALMVTAGWRASFFITSGLGIVVALLSWWLVPRETPREKSAPSSLAAVVRNRNLWFLGLSYFFEGYVFFMFVFWLYLYLVDQRGFTILSGGLVASLPWLAAFVTTPLGGAWCDGLGRRWGSRLRAARVIVVAAYVVSGSFLFVGSQTDSRYLAVGVLSLSLGFLMSAEPAFWSSAIHLGGVQPGAASGLMNMAGILGGVVSTPLVPVLAERFGWGLALASGSLAALLCALTWIGIRVDDG